LLQQIEVEKCTISNGRQQLRNWALHAVDREKASSWQGISPQEHKVTRCVKICVCRKEKQLRQLETTNEKIDNYLPDTCGM
jgi:hypothetical protein